MDCLAGGSHPCCPLFAAGEFLTNPAFAKKVKASKELEKLGYTPVEENMGATLGA